MMLPLAHLSSPRLLTFAIQTLVLTETSTYHHQSPPPLHPGVCIISTALLDCLIKLVFLEHIKHYANITLAAITKSTCIKLIIVQSLKNW